MKKLIHSPRFWLVVGALLVIEKVWALTWHDSSWDRSADIVVLLGGAGVMAAGVFVLRTGARDRPRQGEGADHADRHKRE
ncbi:hypothetical protein [Microbispora rosea]|uniref:hypothetical protein n=1 Tax=Microbispora rosea TaxID=58117 RepID=UPI003D911FE1